MVPALQGGYGTNDLTGGLGLRSGAQYAQWVLVTDITVLAAKRGKCEGDARAEEPAGSSEYVLLTCPPHWRVGIQERGLQNPKVAKSDKQCKQIKPREKRSPWINQLWEKYQSNTVKQFK